MISLHLRLVDATRGVVSRADNAVCTPHIGYVSSVASHPFYIKTVDNSTGTANAFTDGVTGNGKTSGTVVFAVPAGAPNTLYYHCSNHAGMGGKITIVD